MRALFLCALLLAASPALAQEFKVDIAAKGIDPDITRTVTFGYDPAASDAFSPDDEMRYGEQEYPPGDNGLLFRMVGGPERGLTISEDGGKVDIRLKPGAESFMLPFRIRLESGDAGYPVTLRWDRSKIPAIVRHITLSSPVDPSSRTVDMTVQDTMMIGEGERNSFRRVAVRLYYNMEIQPVSVDEVEAHSLSFFPNPYSSVSHIRFSVSEPSHVNIMVLDVAGRVLFEDLGRYDAGNISIPLTDRGTAAGPRFVRVVVMDTRGTRAYERLIIRTN